MKDQKRQIDEKIALEADRIITIDDWNIIKDERTGK